MQQKPRLKRNNKNGKLGKKLVEVYGPTGLEGQVRDLIQEEVKSFVDETYLDALGNLVAYKKGTGNGTKILIADHMDEIGVAD